MILSREPDHRLTASAFQPVTFGRLILIAFSRNWLRSFFTFAAIVAAFCLFGALETIRYEREGPSPDEDLVIVQPDGPGGIPRTRLETIVAMEGVRAAIGITGFAIQNVKAPTQMQVVLAVDETRLPETFASMRISPEVAARWREVRMGALCDKRTAEDMGWKVGEHISVPLAHGMRTASGETTFQFVLLDTYPSGLMLSGLLVRDDYANELLPSGNQAMAALYVRPARASEAQSIAQRIDEQFQTGATPTISAPLHEFRRAAARDASTVRLVIRGALAISFFTMVLIVTNALTQSARERIGEMAVMQALGFQRDTIFLLVFAEAFALFAAGALLGLLLSNIGLEFGIAAIRSNFEVLPLHTVLMAILLAAVCALISVLLPWRELARAPLAEALQRL